MNLLHLIALILFIPTFIWAIRNAFCYFSQLPLKILILCWFMFGLGIICLIIYIYNFIANYSDIDFNDFSRAILLLGWACMLGTSKISKQFSKSKKMIKLYNDFLTLLQIPYIKVTLLITTIAIIGIIVFNFGTILGKTLYYLGF